MLVLLEEQRQRGHMDLGHHLATATAILQTANLTPMVWLATPRLSIDLSLEVVAIWAAPITEVGGGLMAAGEAMAHLDEEEEDMVPQEGEAMVLVVGVVAMALRLVDPTGQVARCEEVAVLLPCLRVLLQVLALALIKDGHRTTATLKNTVPTQVLIPRRQLSTTTSLTTLTPTWLALSPRHHSRVDQARFQRWTLRLKLRAAVVMANTVSCVIATLMSQAWLACNKGRVLAVMILL